ncbi:MAG: Lrp/AsnC family transcriptional regulator, partial [Methanosarcinales archaeon]
MDKEYVIQKIQSNKNGILQSDLWKSLNIDYRDCSKIVLQLKEEGLIERRWESTDNTQTYRILYIGPRVSARELLLAGDMFDPCAGCNDECKPEYCIKLSEWITNLIKA